MTTAVRFHSPLRWLFVFREHMNPFHLVLHFSLHNKECSYAQPVVHSLETIDLTI
jgi:hypothetical protein